MNDLRCVILNIMITISLVQNSSRGNPLSQLFYLVVPSIRQKVPESTFIHAE